MQTMDMNDRFRWLLSATPKQLEAFDALRMGALKTEDPVPLRLLRPFEAAKLTGRSRWSIWRSISAGRIKTVQLREGGVRLIPEGELRKLVGA